MKQWIMKYGLLAVGVGFLLPYGYGKALGRITGGYELWVEMLAAMAVIGVLRIHGMDTDDAATRTIYKHHHYDWVAIAVFVMGVTALARSKGAPATEAFFSVAICGAVLVYLGLLYFRVEEAIAKQKAARREEPTGGQLERIASAPEADRSPLLERVKVDGKGGDLELAAVENGLIYELVDAGETVWSCRWEEIAGSDTDFALSTRSVFTKTDGSSFTVKGAGGNGAALIWEDLHKYIGLARPKKIVGYVKELMEKADSDLE